MADAPYLIFYDGRCAICRRSRQTIERLRPLKGVRFIDVNDAALMAGYPAVAGVDVLGQMHVLAPSGTLSGGYDALIALAPILPGVRWIRPVLAAAPVRAVGRRVYRWIAANRYRLGGRASCRGGVCRLPTAPAAASRP